MIYRLSPAQTKNCWVWYKKKVHKFEYMLLSKLLFFLSCCNLILCRVMYNSSEGRSKLWFVNQEEWIKKILKVNFKGMKGRGGIWKIKKRGWKYGTGPGLLKMGGGKGGWHFSYLIFSRFIIYARFIIYKLLYPLQNYVMRLMKKYFFLRP